MPQSVIKQVEYMAIKEYCDEDLILFLTEMGSPYNCTAMTSIHMMPPYEWITTMIIIILTTQPMKTAPMTKKTMQPMKMAPAPRQPMNIVSDIPLRFLPKTFYIITNKIR